MREWWQRVRAPFRGWFTPKRGSRLERVLRAGGEIRGDMVMGALCFAATAACGAAMWLGMMAGDPWAWVWAPVALVWLVLGLHITD